VVDILLNLKQVAIRMHTRDSAELRLHKKGPGPVTAGDIQTDHDIDVVNPDLVIANLTKAGELSMNLRIERGRGYRPAAARVAFEEQTRPIGRLQLDASFSPVRRVTYSVDAARVEQRTDLDKLVIDIETNGTIDAEEAIRRAASILKDQPVSVRRSAGRGGGRHEGLRDAVRSDPAASRGRVGAHRAQCELPQG